MEDKFKTASNNPNVTCKKKQSIEHWHLVAVFLIIYDLVVGTGSYFVALWLRFDCRFSEIPYEYLVTWLKFAPIYAIVSIVVFWMMHLYQSIWKFASYVELKRIAVSSAILGVFHALFITLLFQRMPISYYLMVFQFNLCWCYLFVLRTALSY